jgi:hypothetical protein
MAMMFADDFGHSSTGNTPKYPTIYLAHSPKSAKIIWYIYEKCSVHMSIVHACSHIYLVSGINKVYSFDPERWKKQELAF